MRPLLRQIAMSKTVGIQGPGGQQRVTISEKSLINELYTAVQSAYGLSSDTSFFLTQDKQKRIVIENSELSTLSKYNLRHGDRLFMHYINAHSQPSKSISESNLLSQVSEVQNSSSQRNMGQNSTTSEKGTTSQSRILQGCTIPGSAPQESRSQDSASHDSTSQSSTVHDNTSSYSPCLPSVAVFANQMEEGVKNKVGWVADLILETL